jgi:superfamily II DNA or RNA helicase
MELRAHQDELARVLRARVVEDLPLDILVDCVPGGGKSHLPGLIAERFSNLKIAWFVPRKSLAKQAALSMSKYFGIDIRESGNETNPSRGTRGFVTTVQGLTEAPELWADELERRDYILVIDELHHAKVDRGGKYSILAAALARLPYAVRLSMTGTLETNDNSLIYNVPYRQSASGYEIDLESFDGHVIRYSRQQALIESAIVPIEFHHHDGEVEWEDADGIQSCNLSDASRNDESQAIGTALRTDLADQLFQNCVSHWKSNGNRLLVVTADQVSARRYVSELRSLGVAGGLAISDEGKDAHKDIDAFRAGSLPALVTCAMAYEGLDVPEITHIACLTHIRSTPWIEQMLARAWRAFPGKTKCWAHVPNDPRMTRVIERIRSEQELAIPYLESRNGSRSSGGAPDQAFVPIRGQLESVGVQMLDGESVDGEVMSELEDICERLGLPRDRASAMLNAARCGGIAQEPRLMTIAEEEMMIRVGITSMCNKADYRKRREPAWHIKELNRINGFRSLTQMDIQELRRARTTAARICS